MRRCIVAAKRQKPVDELQGRGSRFAGNAIVAIARDDRPIPIPPAKLRKAAKDAWVAFWRSPMASLVNDDADLDALRDWAWLISERDRLRPMVHDTPLVPGSMGQLVANPIAALVKDYTRQIDRYREQFGMTPLSRMRLGIAVGEAHNVLSDLSASLDDGPQWVTADAVMGDGHIIEVSS